ncbi:hypothetical protein MKW92_034066 [Papaver armeniacum]|nr:hypothetical protein MKW92_034066 [Papaver armeniacum]
MRESYHPIQAGSIYGIDILPHDNAISELSFCSLFVGRLSHLTTKIHFISWYARIKSLRLVRDIVTGASWGYAFVGYENDREMRRSYEVRGGLGGMKGSGQLRFGGRERPFRAPLRRMNSVDREEEYSHSHKRSKHSHRSRRSRSTSRDHLSDG